MNVLITGATGLVGKALIKKFILENNWNIHILTRDKLKAQREIGLPITTYEWDIASGHIEKDAFKDIDYIINLAGEGIANKRWSDKRKKALKDSRVNSLKLLLSELEKNKSDNFKKIISASAIGIYGDCGDLEIDEDSACGEDFLADLCKSWELPLKEQNKFNFHIMRIGLVLSSNGGALEKMLPAFMGNVAGRLSRGDQYMSWIHIDDLVNQFEFLIKNNIQTKIFNATAPKAVTNKQFTNVLSKRLNKWAFTPAPKFMLSIVLGQMSNLLTTGQKVKPRNFLDHSFKFKYPELSSALDSISLIKRNLSFYQWLPLDKESTFSFFKNHQNLQKITPKDLNLRVLKQTHSDLTQDCEITYKMSKYFLPLKWKAKITSYKEGEHFCDEQISGPFKSWKHTHKFRSLNGGTLIEDHIEFRIHFPIMNPIIINDIKKTFDKRYFLLKEQLRSL